MRRFRRCHVALTTANTPAEAATAMAHAVTACPPDEASFSPICGNRPAPPTSRGVFVGGTGVSVGATGVSVGGTVVAVGGTGVSLGSTVVAVGGTGVSVGGTGVSVGGTGVSVGVTGAPNWTLRSWAAPPPPSRFRVRMWNGAPLIPAAPLPAPQYELLAMCPPQSSSTVDVQPPPPHALAVKVTVMSARLLAVTSPACATAEIDVIVPL